MKLFDSNYRMYTRLCQGVFVLSGILSVLVGIGTIVYKIRSNEETVKQLSTKQKVGVGVIFIATVAFATICIYFGGNWLVSFLDEGVFKTVVKYTIVIVVLYIAVSTMYRAMHKITKGII